MKARIGVVHFPGSNGAQDSVDRIEEAGMDAKLIEFGVSHRDLEKNGKELASLDGAVLPGGFPMNDRLGFGKVPALIHPFTKAIWELNERNAPILAFCSGNQIAHAMNLITGKKDQTQEIYMRHNIGDLEGELVEWRFQDLEPHFKLSCSPKRTAFTRHLEEGEVIQSTISNGGGRLDTSEDVLRRLIEMEQVVFRYSTHSGELIDEYPVNPTGSLGNIDGLTNQRGNVLASMAHFERVLNALERTQANRVFESMKEYIERDCPDLFSFANSQRKFSYERKNFNYQNLDFKPDNTIDLYIEMLTDDHEAGTAQILLGGQVPLERRRVLRVQLREGVSKEGLAQRLVEEIGKEDLFDGIMFKKDLVSVCVPEGTYRFEITDPSTHRREHIGVESLVPGFQREYMEPVDISNPSGYVLARNLKQRNDFLGSIIHGIGITSSWFFKTPEDESKAYDLFLR